MVLSVPRGEPVRAITRDNFIHVLSGSRLCGVEETTVASLEDPNLVSDSADGGAGSSFPLLTASLLALLLTK